ncbi:hypothetical protein ACQPUZ_08260 [Clostridium tertium]
MIDADAVNEECLEEDFSLDDLMKNSSDTTDGIIESTVPRNNSNSDFIEILNIWKKERESELGLKKVVCLSLIAIICLEAIFIGIMVGLQGAGLWFFEEWTFRLIIVSVFAEIVGVFIIVVRSLFPEDSSKAMLELIKHIYGNDK